MNYIDKIATRIGGKCGMNALGDHDGRKLLRLYALLALTTGAKTTSEHVHDAWAAWRAETMPRHKSLVPFNELTPEVQALDDEYRDAIRTVVAEMALENGPHDHDHLENG